LQTAIGARLCARFLTLTSGAESHTSARSGERSVWTFGGVPEWLKGTGCKPVGLAYVGSNPTPSTMYFYT
jgi:hypothetical protein